MKKVWMVFYTVQDGFSVYQHLDSIWDDREKASQRGREVNKGKPLVGSSKARIAIVYIQEKMLNAPPVPAQEEQK